MIWKGHIKRHSQIKVTHFGPLGKANATNWIKDFRNKGSDYWDKFKDIAKVNDSQGWSMKSQSEQDQDRASMRKAIDIDFLKCKEKKINAIDRIKSDLKDEIKKLKAYGLSDETVSDLCQKIDHKDSMIANDVAKIVVKIIEMDAKEVFKLSAKFAGKSLKSVPKCLVPLAKSGGRAPAKKIPVLGAVFGVAFGIGRLCQGDPKMAALELASGVASLGDIFVPGAGSATSLALDGLILKLDIDEEKEKHETHKAEILGDQ